MAKRLSKAGTIGMLLRGHHLILMKGVYASFYMSGTLDTVPLKTALSLIDEGLVKISKSDWKSTEYIMK